MHASYSVRPRRQAFTLIELLVVIAIISVLVGLILPAVQNAREAARRVQCRNHLKQIGIALNSYVQLRGVYPPGYVYNPNPGAPFLGWSWQTMLLPMLDQAPLYDKVSSQFELGVPATDWTDSQPLLAVFRCPSDVGDAVVSNVNVAGSNNSYSLPGATTTSPTAFSRSNYFGVAGSWNNAGTLTGLNADGTPGIVTIATFQGTFGENSGIFPAQIQDGSSNTIVVGERYTPVASIVSSSPSTTTTSGGGQCPNASNTATGTTTTPSTTSLATTGDGIWIAATSRANSTSGAVITGQAYVFGDTAASGVPATAFAQNGNNGQSQRGLTTGFGSLHAGGAFYLFGDGSVRLINDSIDLSIYRNLGTINDGAPRADF